MSAIDDLLAKAAPVERTVEICLRGDLAAEMQEAERDLVEAKKYDAAHNEPNRAPEVAERLGALEADAAEATVTFRVRALGFRAWEALQQAHPAGPEHPDAQWDPVRFPVAAIAACVVDPEMTEAQVERLAETLSVYQFEELAGAVVGANMGADRLPKSEAATALLRASGRNSTTASRSESLTASS